VYFDTAGGFNRKAYEKGCEERGADCDVRVVNVHRIGDVVWLFEQMMYSFDKPGVVVLDGVSTLLSEFLDDRWKSDVNEMGQMLLHQLRYFPRKLGVPVIVRL
jgi:hypothetical protein